MYYIGYELGVSLISVALVDVKTGKKVIVLSEAPREMQVVSFYEGWAEQNPEIWWEYICKLTKRVIFEANIKASKIQGIGISYQMHGLVIVGSSGNPLRNAILGTDSRADSIGNAAFEEIGKEKCIEHLLNSPGGFPVSKLKWIKENEPEIYRKVHKYMLPGDYIAYRLTGSFTTTKNALAEGMLWDYKEDKLAVWLLNYYGIDPSLTPDIKTNFQSQGVLNKAGSIESGLCEGTPLLYRAGDMSNNALSLNVLNPGEVAITAANGCFFYAVSEIASRKITMVSNIAHVNYEFNIPRIGRLLTLNAAGIQHRWLRNNTGIETYGSINRKAATIPIGSDGVVVIPFGNGPERVLNSKNIGSHFLNLNLNLHNNAHLFRASLEGIAFSYVNAIESLTQHDMIINVLRARNDNLFSSKIFSDTIATLLGQRVEIYDTTGAVGAARAVGLKNGHDNKFGSSILAHDHLITFLPLKNKEPYFKAYQKWKQELKCILGNK